MDFSYLYTSTEGRIGRQSFWIGVLGFFVVGVILVLLGWVLGMSVMSFTTRLILFIVAVAFAYPYYALFGKRFQDRSKPATFALFGVGYSLLKSFTDMIGWTGNPFAMGTLDYIFSVVGLVIFIWYLIELGILRGTVGPNTYGPDPLEGQRL
jgi:uncharacterized membrane protein YhaH (DUF805 family)